MDPLAPVSRDKRIPRLLLRVWMDANVRLSSLVQIIRGAGGKECAYLALLTVMDELAPVFQYFSLHFW